MSEPAKIRKGRLRGAWIRFRVLLGAIGSSAQRIYAAVLIVVIVWLCFLTVRYLVRGLIAPAETPAQIAAVPRQLDESILHGAPRDWLGLSSVENPRAPASHYHRFDSWLQNDPYNDCTRSGCHSPLPHARRKEDRAFLNMHATSIHCGVCHFKDEERPRNVTWYSLASGKPGPRPPLLDAFDWLARWSAARRASSAPIAESDEFSTPKAQAELVRMLRRSADEGQAPPQLARVAEDIRAVRAGSPQYERLLGSAEDAVRSALRGSYGSKLAARDDAGKPMLAHPDTRDAVKDWLARGQSLERAEREQVLARVHPLRREKALECSECHRADNPRLDFARLGYPAARVQTLVTSRVFEMIQNIRDGRSFYLPDVGVTSEPQPQP